MAQRKEDQLKGIETRTDARGRSSYRPYVTHPQDRNRKVRGEWTHNLAEARGWRVRKQAALADGQDILPRAGLPTVREAAERFITGAHEGVTLSKRRATYAASTLEGYVKVLERFVYPELGRYPIDKLRRSDVQRLVDAVYRECGASWTLRVATVLGALYTHLLPRHDEIGHDPTSGLQLPSPPAARERYAEPGEMIELLAPLAHDQALPFALAFYAGLRHSEIQALPVDCVDLAGGWIDVRWSYSAAGARIERPFKKPKTKAGERHIPIFDQLRPYLVEQMARVIQAGDVQASTDEAPGTLLASGQTRYGVCEYGRHFMARCKRTWDAHGLEPIGLHEGRHSFITALVRSGLDIKTIQEWAGHAHASTTLDIYTKQRGRVLSTEMVQGVSGYLGT